MKRKKILKRLLPERMHFSLGRRIQILRSMTFEILCDVSKACGTNSKAERHVLQSRNALEKLRCELDDVVYDTFPRGSDGKDLEVHGAYYGGDRKNKCCVEWCRSEIDEDSFCAEHKIMRSLTDYEAQYIRPSLFETTYFVVDEDSMCIKIGSSSNPKRRLSQLQEKTHRPLCLIGSINLKEKDLHNWFWDIHAEDWLHLPHGTEWFYPRKRLIKFLERIGIDVSVFSSLDYSEDPGELSEKNIILEINRQEILRGVARL